MKWYQELKKEPCTDCGQVYHFAIMEWDHLPQHTKVATVSDVARQTLNKTKVLAEIAKCELVCANCHNMREWARTNG
jgi:hypothetical protein